MSWDYKPITIKERLEKLENELDELIHLHEVARKSNRNTFRGGDYNDKTVQKHDCVNITSNTHNIANTHHPCLQSKSATEPLSEISKFLQHLNLNISKGTQAITKIANLTAQKKCDADVGKLYHENCFKKNILTYPDNKSLFTKSSIEDDLFKEIREEKEKRQRAENQVKLLKAEISNSRIELKQNSDDILLLQTELKQTLQNLEEAKTQIHKLHQDQQASECLWPFQYQALSRELQDEQIRRAEAEKRAQALQDKFKKEFDSIEKSFKVKSSVNWLNSQNQHLTCLIEKLQTEIKNCKLQILSKNQIIEDNYKKTRQLISVCEKLRDHLILMKNKVADGEEKLRNSLIHCEKLTATLLKEQEKIGELERRQIRDREEQHRLIQTVKTVNETNESLQVRLNELSEIVRQQKELIDCQSEKLMSKEDQMKLAYENIKLRSEREKELETKIKSLTSEVMEKQQLVVNNDNIKIKLELENEQEKVLIQEKIIESHLQTSIKLKATLTEKDNEIHQLKIDLAEKERKLKIELNTNDQMMSKIKSLQSCKQELKQKVRELEEELEAAECSEQAKRLDLIEKQLLAKQKKLEEYNSLIKQEKETILETLRCTTQKLENTITELKEELTNKENTMKCLKSQLSDKAQQLKEALEKNSLLSDELDKALECSRKTENIYQEKLKSACDAWKTTMQILQS